MRLQKVDIENSFHEMFSYVGEKVQHSLAPLIIILEAGHFNSRYGPDQQSIHTLTGALQLANNLILEHKKRIKIVLALLVDDLGLSCNIDVCAVADNEKQTDSSFPNELSVILENSSIYNARQFVLCSERTAKNRGIAKLKGLIKTKTTALDNVFQMEKENGKERFYFLAKDGQKVLLADIEDWVWGTHCPLIMGQHYFDLHKMISKRYPYNWSQILIDFSSIQERGKVNRGAELAILLLSLEQPERVYEIINICFADEEGEVYVADYFKH
jgi:hypothetical protein